METNVLNVSIVDKNCLNEIEKQIKYLEEFMDLHRTYSPCSDSKLLLINQESSQICKERIDSLIGENKKLKESLLIKDDLIINLQKEIKLIKLDIFETKKANEKLNIELEIAKKERNDNILQIHELLKRERQQNPSHLFKESFSSINTISTNTNFIDEKNLIEKINNEKNFMEGKLIEVKFRNAELQNENETYKDQIFSLRRKIQEADDKITKKEEIIQKLILSKEKIPLNDFNQLMSASRLDLTIALTESSNNTIGSNNIKTAPTNSNLTITPNCKRLIQQSPLTLNNDISFGNIKSINGNYSSCQNKMSNFNTPDKNCLSAKEKESKEKSSLLNKFKNFFSNEKKAK